MSEETKINLTKEEQKRFDALPPITYEQQKLIDQLAELMVEQYYDENK